MMLVKRPTSRSLYFGSGSISRLGTSRRRGTCRSPGGGAATAPPPASLPDARGRRSVTRRPAGRTRRPLLRPLRPVLRPPLVSGRDALRVERAAHDVVADARQVLDATAAHEHDRVLLEIVPLAGDVGVHLAAVREPHARDLAQRRVRLLRRRREDAQADSAPLRRAHQVRGGGARRLRPATVADQLLDGRQRRPRRKDTNPPCPTLGVEGTGGAAPRET